MDLLGTTLYVLVLSLMIFAVLVLGPRLCQIVTVVLVVAYVVTIVVAAVGRAPVLPGGQHRRARAPLAE